MPQAKRKIKAATRRPLPQRKPAPQRARTTAMVVSAPHPESWRLNTEEIELLKNSICKGATDVELKFCLAVARRYKVDPFKQQIWFIRRWDKNAVNAQGALGAHVWVPQVGIYGMMHIAARDHRDYGSLSVPEYGPETTVEVEGHKVKGPSWARVRAFKKGVSEPTVGEAFFAEYCPKRYENTLFWRTMPHRMIAKCAKAQAIREAYPDLGGLYIPEETQKMMDEVAPSGRIIHAAEPQLSPAEENWKRREAEGISKLTPAQQEVVKSKMADANINRPTDCLFYVEVNGTYRIDGAQSLKMAHKELLRPLWSETAGALVATPQQLGKLISQFEQLKVKFIPWPPLREPGSEG